MDSKLKIRFIESDSFDPWLNLAYEEFLLNNLEHNEVLLYLWQNERTVVIGVNQNPWKECDINLLEKDGGKLARRMSGGGAVYHDLGNLNFTFIVDKNFYDFSKQIKVITDSLVELGISAEFTGRNDILVNKRKISGNAFYYRNRVSLHHGTILVDSDFNNLTKYLHVSKDKIQSKGIESIKSRVVNLKEVDSTLTIEKIKTSLKKQFSTNYGMYEQIFFNKLDEQVLKDLYNKYSSWEWRFGDTPKFEISLSRRFELGEVDINLNLSKGIIQEVGIYSDAMDPDIARNIKGVLIGTSLKEITKRMENSNIDNIDNEIKKWIINELKNL